MKKVYVLILLVALFCSLSPNFSVHAATAGLQINEVYYDTVGTDSKEEWIELYNPTDLDLDLSGYELKSNEPAPFIIVSGTIKAKSFFVIARNTAGFHTLYDLDPSIEAMTINLSNDGDYVVLLDPAGAEIDSIAWGNSAYPGIISSKVVKTGHSLERKILGFDSDDCSVDFVEIPVPSPFAKYEKPTYLDSVELSEVLAYPADESREEFIELHNKTAIAVDLSGWVVDDEEGGSSGYTIPKGVRIEPNGYLAFYHSMTGIFLNNDTDSARLLDPNGDLKSSVTYDKAKKDLGYALFDGSWRWTAQPTPGNENQYKEAVVAISSGSSPSSASIASTNGATTVDGRVTAWPGVLSDQIFYLSTGSKGYEIYNYYGEFPELKQGDSVSVSGSLTAANRIKISSSSAVNLKSGEIPVSPILLSISDIGERYTDQYVQIQGRISKTSGDTFYVADLVSATEIKILIRESTGIDKPPMKVGDIFKVAGIVSLYKNEYRILPFRAEDVTISTSDYTGSGILPVAGGDEKVVLIISSLLFIIWNLFLTTKKKQKNLPRTLPRW
ncbi:MAG: lamin tail domain-containing protein [Candidatus Berkelbacteria bacterium]